MPPALIVAADNMPLGSVTRLAWLLKDRGIWGIKLNDGLLRDGTYALRQLWQTGLAVMADPKLKDIPQTMINCIAHLEDSHAQIITVHIDSGTRALLECRKAAKKAQLFGITVLTSMSDAEVESIYNKPRMEVVENFMNMASLAGLNGIVCAADCIPLAKNKGLKTLVPGIRLPELGPINNDDQVHLASEIPDSDYIVVGRPITQASEPVLAVQKIRALMERANTAKLDREEADKI